MVDEPVPGIPLPPEAGPRKWDWRLSVTSVLALLPIIIALLVVIPECEKVFRQIRIQLPAPAVVLIFLSRATCRYLWLVGLSLVVFSAEVGHLTGWKAKLARTLLPLVPLVVGLWMIFSLISPLIGCTFGVVPRRHG